jgi:thiamine pyrophosphate-dependent acetolactate synthase large subunit-like protein
MHAGRLIESGVDSVFGLPVDPINSVIETLADTAKTEPTVTASWPLAIEAMTDFARH